tara:strand:- start:11860 stop:12093 length:234 start_codon:yes stop_codon:yes gene_type:complete
METNKYTKPTSIYWDMKYEYGMVNKIELNQNADLFILPSVNNDCRGNEVFRPIIKVKVVNNVNILENWSLPSTYSYI